jgi:hypothetical protein
MEYSLLINDVRDIRGLSIDSADSDVEQPKPFWYDWLYYCCGCCGPAEN